MPVVCVLLVLGLSSPNPLSMSAVRGAAFDPARPGIVALVRHPVLWAALLWALAHLVPNGDLAHVILFGLLALLAGGGMLIFDRRQRRRLGEEEWARLAAHSSNLPFRGLRGSGGIALPGGADVWRLVAALLLDRLGGGAWQARKAKLKKRLLEIADRCPVHRTLQSEVEIPTSLSEHPVAIMDDSD